MSCTGSTLKFRNLRILFCNPRPRHLKTIHHLISILSAFSSLLSFLFSYLYPPLGALCCLVSGICSVFLIFIISLLSTLTFILCFLISVLVLILSSLMLILFYDPLDSFFFYFYFLISVLKSLLLFPKLCSMFSVSVS